jgi:hypothetical protein
VVCVAQEEVEAPPPDVSFDGEEVEGGLLSPPEGEDDEGGGV